VPEPVPAPIPQPVPALILNQFLIQSEIDRSYPTICWTFNLQSKSKIKMQSRIVGLPNVGKSTLFNAFCQC